MGRTLRRRARRKDGSQIQNISADLSFINLLKWMTSGGWEEVCALRLTEFPVTGRGLMAKWNIEKGDTLASLPFALLVTTATVCSSSSGDILKTIVKEQPEISFWSQELLAVFLVWERHLGKSSSWDSYLSTLPSSFSTPHLLKEEHASALPEFVLDSVVSSKGLVNESYSHLQACLKIHCCSHCNKAASEILSWNNFLWGWCCVNTRAVYLEPSHVPVHELPIKDKNCLALAPYLDMFNHSDVAEVSVSLNPANGRYEIRTLQPIKRFQEVFINYGSHSNIKLYAEYGFVLPSNVHDVVPLKYVDIKEAFLLTEIKITDEWEKTSFFKKYQLLSNLSISRSGLSWNAKIIIRILKCEVNNVKIWATIAFTDNGNEIYSMAVFCDIITSLYKKTKEYLNTSLQSLSLVSQGIYENSVSNECLKTSQLLLLQLISVIESAITKLELRK